MSGRLVRALALALLLSGAGFAAAEAFLPVRAIPVSRFRIGSDETRFGALEFAGGLELRSSAREFGSISGFRFMEDRRRFVAVTDTGNWLFGRLERDGQGRPAGFAEVRAQPITDAAGRVAAKKEEVDAEALELDGEWAYVGFEHDHRVARYRIVDGRASDELGRVEVPIPRHELRRNGSFEAVARAPASLARALIVLTEFSVDSGGNLFAAIAEGPKRGVFKLVKEENFGVTDAVFLPGGDLLVLERSFALAQGVRMRLRRIAAADIVPGRVVRGEEILRADMRYQIDNMEAMDAWVDDEGRLRIAILSDDNQSFVQRTLYLEFVAPAGAVREKRAP